MCAMHIRTRLHDSVAIVVCLLHQSLTLYTNIRMYLKHASPFLPLDAYTNLSSS